MNALQETRSHSSVARRALTTAMLSCFALAGWFWSNESSPKHHQATAATISRPASQPIVSSPTRESSNASPITANPTPRYVTKNIEDIREGDDVLAREEHGEQITLRRVVEAYRRTSYHLRQLTFEAEDGSTQTIQTTDEHPFWHAGREEWIEAGRFVIGDPVTAPNGHIQTLIANHRCEHPEGVPVFNFQVEGVHTYFVSMVLGNAPILVHNSECGITATSGVVDKWRRLPGSIQERMVMEAAQGGAGTKNIDDLGDPLFKGMEKWQYKEKSAAGIDAVVHYVRDPVTGLLSDFKFR